MLSISFSKIVRLLIFNFLRLIGQASILVEPAFAVRLLVLD